MKSSLKLGRQGELLAARYLDSLGYKILEYNYRFKKAEIDIIAKEEKILVFVEVKTRSSEKYGPPELSISERKVVLLMDAAYSYMQGVNYSWEIRFDVISIIINKRQGLKLKHLKDAFVP